MPVVPPTHKADIGRIDVVGQHRQKVGRTPSHPTSWVWWFMSVILATLEVEIGRIIFRGLPGQKVSKTPSQPISWV
jgi:hypothetical protein